MPARSSSPPIFARRSMPLAGFSGRSRPTTCWDAFSQRFASANDPGLHSDGTLAIFHAAFRLFRRISMRHMLLGLCVVLVASGPLCAQPLADRVPADAIVYIGWRGTQDLGPAYNGSHLKAVVDASDFVATWDK